MKCASGGCAALGSAAEHGAVADSAAAITMLAAGLDWTGLVVRRGRSDGVEVGRGPACKWVGARACLRWRRHWASRDEEGKVRTGNPGGRHAKPGRSGLVPPPL